ncbi:hypothetical protein WNY59_00095 [Ahrensia kielensis]|uniref:Uncharacterized protein n=1 Tax=Ahrensia kielensis TaxID=76980 RepID=A0ABU9T2J4_9HYPH
MLKFRHQLALLSGAISLSLAASVTTVLADDETKEVWRLFVSDQAESKVTVIDPTEGKILQQFTTDGYATHLVPSQSGETLFAVQMDHDAVNVIASGISLSGHGDHSDIEIEKSKILPMKLEGARPVHVIPHGDKMVQFFDREGEARVYSEHELLEGNADYKTVKTAAPHHGVVVPMGDYFLASEPNLMVETKADELPPRLGVKAIDKNGETAGNVATCTGLHGEAHSAGLVAFGCEEGVIIASVDGSNVPEFKMLEYSVDMPEGQVGTLAGGKAMQFFLGNYGADKLVIIDPSTVNPYQVVNLPVRYVSFALDPENVKIAYVFTEDGKLSALNILSGKLEHSAQITEPYSKDGHWRDPRPRIAVMGDIIAVTDPNKGLVRLLDSKSFKEEKTITVEGLPFNITAIGGSGLQH